MQAAQGRGRETSGATCILQAGSGGGSDQAGSGGQHGKGGRWLVPGISLRLSPVELPSGWSGGCESKKSRGDSRVLA